MARILAHPFRLTPAGVVVTHDDSSDEADAQAIAVLISTRIGERPLAPDYGVDDPVGGRLEIAEVAAGLAAYGPPLTITDVTIEPVDDRTEDITVYYTDEADLDDDVDTDEE